MFRLFYVVSFHFFCTEIDPQTSGIIWAFLVLSFASVFAFPGKSSFRVFTFFVIVRSILSIDIEPTLGLLGAINLIIKAIHLISIMGNHGTFNKKLSKIIIDREFEYHIVYLFFCSIGLFLQPLFYSILVSFCFDETASGLSFVFGCSC